MKGNCGRMTLAGTIEDITFGDAMHRAVKTILEYSNVLDTSKAWKLKSIQAWMKSTTESAGLTTDAQFDLRFQLNTDDMNQEAFWDAGDNRAIAFGEVAYAAQQTTYKPTSSYSLAPMQNLNSEWYVQPDHVIQTRLDLAVAGKGAGTTTEGKTFDINYIVELEEIAISNIESIVYNIKAKGQDLSS